ncbi:hypothetical protein EBZ37_13800, partial [bacterium]|nr:hypothetical protein [bacterium]
IIEAAFKELNEDDELRCEELLDFCSTVWGEENAALVFEDAIRKVFSSGKLTALLRRILRYSFATSEVETGLWLLDKAEVLGHAELADLAWEYMKRVKVDSEKFLYHAGITAESDLAGFAALGTLLRLSGSKENFASRISVLDPRWTVLLAKDSCPAARLRKAWLVGLLDISKHSKDLRELLSDVAADALKQIEQASEGSSVGGNKVSVLGRVGRLADRSRLALTAKLGDRGVQVLLQQVVKNSNPELTRLAFEELLSSGVSQGANWESGIYTSLFEMVGRGNFSISEARTSLRLLKLVGRGSSPKVDQLRKSLGERLTERLQLLMAAVKEKAAQVGETGTMTGSSAGGGQPAVQSVGTSQYQLQWRTVRRTNESDALNVVGVVFECLGE